MKHHRMLPFRNCALHGLALLGVARSAAALSQTYCSSQNTGSDFQAVVDTYQSNGACYGTCQGSYAFAIVQYQSCWCSNYIPAEQDSTSSCDQTCPGYPDDLCGNQGNNLYGYIRLPHQPSGTMGASSSSQSSSTSSEKTSTYSSPSSSPSPSSQAETSTSDPPTTSAVDQTVFRTVTQDPGTSVVFSTVFPTPSTSTTSTSATSTSQSYAYDPSTSSTYEPTTSDYSSTSSTPSSTRSPVTSVQIITVSGGPVTQTVTSTPWVAANPDANQVALHRKGLSGGAIAGIVIGVLAALAAILLGAFLLWRRKRNDGNVAGSGAGPLRSPHRTTSVLSKTGLLARSGAKGHVRESSWVEPLYVNTGTGNSSVRHSALYGAGAAGAGVSPVSPLDSQSNDDSTRRHSKPLVYDQRLNPSALFANHEANGSRVSMQDQHDFSRPLAIVNPDQRASFESRTSRHG